MRHIVDLLVRHVVVQHRGFDVSQDVRTVGLHDLIVVGFEVLFE